MYYHLNKKDAVKAVVEQNNTYLLIKRCSETVKGDNNLVRAWIDYKKAYDSVPHSWIGEYLEMLSIANNVQNFLNNSMKSWNLKLNASGEK